MYTEVTMPDGRLVRLEPQDGPPTEPGEYLAEYTPFHGERHTIAREVRIDGAGRLDHGPDSARLEWWARIVDDTQPASGKPCPRGSASLPALSGETCEQGTPSQPVGGGVPSTPGREGASRQWCPDCGPETGTYPECDMCGAGPEVQP